MKQVFQSVGISAASLLISVLLGYIVLGLTDIAALRGDPARPLNVGFDLIVISWGVLIAAYIGNPNDKLRSALFIPAIWTTIFCLFGLVFLLLLPILLKEGDLKLYTLLIPILLGIISVTWSASVVIRTRSTGVGGNESG